jgi:hypothetical protein
MKTTASLQTVKNALWKVNQDQGYQLEFKTLSQSGKFVNFTIKSKSGIPGSKLSVAGHKLAAASWHAHGLLIDEIFRIDPACTVSSMGKTFDDKTWDWEDRNEGSIFNPVWSSSLSIL